MKKIILGFLALFMAIGVFAADYTPYEKVLQEKDNNKGILIIVFSMDGCGPCVKLKNVLTEKQKSYPALKVFYVDIRNDAYFKENHDLLLQQFSAGENPVVPVAIVYNKQSSQTFKGKDNQNLPDYIDGLFKK